MAFKMSQEFPTASMDITEDFHILHSAYVYICYSILKAKTYNWLPNTQTHRHTHTHTHQQQLQTKRHVSSFRVGLSNGTKQTPSQNWGTYYQSCMYPTNCLTAISDAFSASFTSIWPSFPRFYCTPNKACLLCATPAGTYRISPEFPKMVYSRFVQQRIYYWSKYCLKK